MNICVARALAVVMSKCFVDTPEEWDAWPSMSQHVEEVVCETGLWGASEALRFWG